MKGNISPRVGQKGRNLDSLPHHLSARGEILRNDMNKKIGFAGGKDGMQKKQTKEGQLKRNISGKFERYALTPTPTIPR